MSTSAKKIIFWSVYVFLILGGVRVKTANLLPVNSTAIFVIALLWIWTGLSTLCRIDPCYGRNLGRKRQRLLALNAIGIGIAWGILSFTPLSSRALPVILVSVPFLILDLLVPLLCPKS